VIGVPGATSATQTANPVTAVAQGAQMRTLVLGHVPARYNVYSGTASLSRQDVTFLSFSIMSSGT
jgi:ribonuclease BN (tRNA processing enzyme)